MKRHLLTASLAAFVSLGALFASPAGAADTPTYPYYKAPAAAFNWTGFYVKGDVGYAFGDLDISVAGNGVNINPRGITAGVGLGFDYHLASNIVIGAVLDASWLGARQSAAIGPVNISGDLDYVGTVRGNIGYSFGTWLPYLTAGYGWGHLQSDVSLVNLSANDFASGFVWGGGIKLALTRNWAASLEYLRYDFDGSLNFGPGTAAATADIQTLKIGVHYRFGN